MTSRKQLESMNSRRVVFSHCKEDYWTSTLLSSNDCRGNAMMASTSHRNLLAFCWIDDSELLNASSRGVVPSCWSIGSIPVIYRIQHALHVPCVLPSPLLLSILRVEIFSSSWRWSRRFCSSSSARRRAAASSAFRVSSSRR